MSMGTSSVAECLRIDAEREADRIAAAIRHFVRSARRRGLVLGLSGGIDSSVCAALAARALGPERVFGLMMPEAESSPESLELSRVLEAHLRIRTAVEDITPILEAAGCYERRDAAIRSVVPDYSAGYRSKLVLANTIAEDGYRISSIVVQSPEGVQTRVRLTAAAYLAIVAASNFKQRVRKMLEYHHADRLQYAVLGTPNRLEYDQGFFVKNGDGAADIKPIAHLYKTQVYQLAEFLGVPEGIRRRPPTTDTYSLAQSQEEFYFTLPCQELDICLFGLNNGIPADAVAAEIGLSPEQAGRVYRDLEAKRTATRYLHQAPVLVEAISPASTPLGPRT